MFDPSTDPLGVAVQGRARDRRFALAAQGLLPAIGPLPDPKWEGFFQAASEQAGNKRLNFAEGPDFQGSPQQNALEGLRRPVKPYEPFDDWATRTKASIYGKGKG